MNYFRFFVKELSVVLICLTFATGADAQIVKRKVERPVDTRYTEMKHEANDISLSIVVSGMTCTCARFAEDIRNVMNDMRPDGLRILPVLGVGGAQNVKDLLFLKGIDMAVIDQDNLTIMKKKDPILYGNLEQRIQYITKLYNAEFHVLARNEIQSFSDLKGRRVNFNLKESQTEITADNVFKILNIDVVKSSYDNDEAIKKVISGELDAMIILTGAPQSSLAKLKKSDGVHFLALDPESYKGNNIDKLYDEYLPADLTNDLYPNLIDPGQTVPTIANRAVLAVLVRPENTEKYRMLVKFVNELFVKIDQFKDPARHPKWKEVNLMAEVPGWVRFKPAQDLIDAQKKPVNKPQAKLTKFKEFKPSQEEKSSPH